MSMTDKEMELITNFRLASKKGKRRIERIAKQMEKEQKMASIKGCRLLKVLKALKGQAVTGISNKDIADVLGLSPVDVSRDLEDLIEEGLAIKLDNGRFAHSVQMIQIAQAYATQIARIQGQITEMNQRIAAGSIN
ncbi:MAG: HTH domain-containing protein [Burkholderiaceae bacterium]